MDDTSSQPDPPTHLSDGALAAVLLVAAIAVVRIADIAIALSAILAGVAATLGFEIVAGQNPDPVRRAWARREVRIGAVSVAVLFGGVALVVRAGWLVIAGAAALACYLVVLTLVVSGVVPPPGSWIDRT